MRSESPDISLGLKNLAEDHQENLPDYLEAEGYTTVLKAYHKVLDFFEDELGREDRHGRWLGGASVSIADITLGKELVTRNVILYVKQGFICTGCGSWAWKKSFIKMV